ncbi:MAG: hypothetical protein ACOCYA_04845 [Spirochaetota bacterium]
MSVRHFFRCVLCICAVFLLTGGVIFGQSNEILDTVLEQDSLVTEYGAYLVFTASEMLPETVSVDEAADFLGIVEEEWKLKDYSSESPITLGQYAYLITRAFEIKEGLFYRLFPGSRYAVRDLAFLGIVREHPNAGRTLSGEEAVRILGNTLEWLDTRS